MTENTESKDIRATGPKALKGIRNSDLYNNLTNSPTDFFGSALPDEFKNQISSLYKQSAENNYKVAHGYVGHDALQDLQSEVQLDPTIEYGDSMFDEGLLIGDTDQQDIINQRADNQSGALKLGAGITKMGILAGTTFLDGTVGLVMGIGTAINGGRFSGIWDNEFNRAMDAINKWSEKELPNYYSQEELNNPWYKNILTTNWIGDKFLKNVGFTIGAIFSGGSYASAFRGLGSLAKGAALKAGKAYSTVKNISQTSSIVSSAAGAIISATGEGSIEALQNAADFKNMKITELKDQHEQNLAAIKEQYGNSEILPILLQQEEEKYQKGLQMIELDTKRMGNMVLSLNIPILTIGNLIQFGKMYGNGFKKARELQKAERFSSFGSLRGKMGKYKGMSKTKAIGKPIFNALTEGNEELLQQSAAFTAGHYYGDSLIEDYRNARFDEEARAAQRNFVKSMAKGLLETYGDGDQWEQFAIGALTGALGMPSFSRTKNAAGKNRVSMHMNGGLWDISRNLTARRAQNELAERLNNRINSEEFRNYYEAQVALRRFQIQSDQAAMDNDPLAFHDAEDNALVKDIDMFLQAGKLSDLKALIRANLDSENMTDEDIESLIKNTSKKITAEENNKIAANISNKIAIIEQQYEELKHQFAERNGHPYTKMSRRDALKADRASVESFDALEAQLSALKRDAERYSEIEEGDRVIGPFVDNMGNAMSIDKVKLELNKQRDSIIGTIDDYAKAWEVAQEYSKDPIPKDQLAELSWMYVKANRLWPLRMDSMAQNFITKLKEIAPNLESTIGNISDSIDSLTKQHEKLRDILNKITDPNEKALVTAILNNYEAEKNRGIKSKTALKNLHRVLRQISALAIVSRVNNDGTRTAKASEVIASEANKDTIDEILKALKSLPENVIDKLQLEQLERSMADMRKIAKVREEFIKKWQYYVTNPKQHAAAIRAAENKAEQQATEKANTNMLVKIINRFNWNNSISELAKTYQQNKKDIENSGGLDKFLSLLNEDQREKMKNVLDYSKALNIFNNALNNTDTLSPTEKNILKKMQEDEAQKANSFNEVLERLTERLRDPKIGNQFMEDPNMPSPIELQRAANFLQKADTFLKELLESWAARLEHYDEGEKYKKQANYWDNKDDERSNPKEPKEPSKNENPESTNNSQENVQKDNNNDDNNESPRTFTEQEEREIKQANDPTDEYDVRRSNKGGGSQNQGNSYSSRPWISEFALANDSEQSVADYYREHPEKLPKLPEGVSESDYIHYLETINEYLKRAGSFTYIKGINDSSRLRINDSITFRKIEDLGEGMPIVVGIYSGNQLLGVLPSSWELASTPKGKNQTVEETNPGLRALFDAAVKGEKITTSVDKLMGGRVSIGNEHSLYEIFNGKTPIIGVVDENGLIKTGTRSINKKIISSKPLTPGQVYVLIPSNTGDYVPMLCYSTSIKGTSFFEAAIDKLATLGDIKNTKTAIKQVKAFINIPGLTARFYSIDPNSGKKVYTSNYDSESAGVQFGYFNNIGEWRVSNYPLSVTGIDDLKENMRIIASNFLNKMLEEYPNITTNVSLELLHSNPSYNSDILQNLYTNVSSTHTVNDWFTWKPTKAELDAKEHKINPEHKASSDPRINNKTLEGSNIAITNTIPLDLGEPTASNVNTSSTGISFDLSNKKRRKPKNMEVSRTEDTPLEVTQATIDKVTKFFPELAEEGRIVVVNGLTSINEKGEPVEVYGKFKDGVLYLNSKAPIGTGFHEAFHYVMDTLLNKDTINTLFEEGKSLYGTNDKMEIEERLAEDFRHYMNDITAPGIKGTIKRIFEFLKSILRGLSRNTNSLDSVFYDLYKGKRPVSTDTFSEDLQEYKERKYSYDHLDIEAKEYLNKRGISKEEYEKFPVEDQETILRCM